VSNNRRLLASATVLPLLAMLAGCVGSSVSTPLTPGSSGSGATPTPAASTSAASPNPSPTASLTAPVLATWTFGGSTADLVAASGATPALVTLPVYQGITSTIQFGTVASGSGTINVSDATNPSSGGDITPVTLPADNATTGAQAIAYVSFYNGTLADISFGASTPAITITNAAGFGTATTCELDAYSNGSGSSLAWTTTGATGTIAGNNVTINAATLSAGNTVDLVPGQTITAIACK